MFSCARLFHSRDHRERQRGGHETCLLGYHGSEKANSAWNCQPRPTEGVCKWGACELNMLGRYADQDVAKITGRKLSEVIAKRNELNR